MKNLTKAAAVLALAAVLTVPAFGWNFPWAQKSANKLALQGSTTVLPIAQKAAEEYMKINKEADISVSGGGSGVGISGIIDSSCDIGDASRSIKSKEILTAKQKGVNPVGTIIAKDGIAIIVNPSNNVAALSIDQLKAIYSCSFKKWSQIGGSDDMIVVISRDSSSGTFEVFNEKVLEGAKLREDSLMQAANKEVEEAVAKTPGAIGYVGLGYVGSDVKALTIEGVMPSDSTVLNGTYRLSRPLYMYTNGDPSGLAKEFIDYLLSDAGQQIVKDVGFVALNAK
jgi:phosphate transport system substrate-binding protein